MIKIILRQKFSEEVFEEFSNFLEINDNKKIKILKALLEGEWIFSNSPLFKIIDLQEINSFKENIEIRKSALNIIKLFYYFKQIKQDELLKIDNLEKLNQKITEIENKSGEKNLEEIIQKEFSEARYKKFFVELTKTEKEFLFPLDIKNKARGTTKYFYFCLKTNDKNKNKVMKKLINEWQERIYKDFQDAEKEIQISEIIKYKNLTLRYLNKKSDFYECLRIADSVDCCFNNSREIFNTQKFYKYKAQLWADPLSFMFQVEKRENKKIKPLGFVFGNFGVIKNKELNKEELAVLLNGIYLSFDSQHVAKRILDIIEEKFSKKINAKWRIVGVENDLKTPPSYTAVYQEIKRFRALKNKEQPIKQVFDDLGKKVNCYYKNKYLRGKKI
ncbi:MAG: hypothetical protein QXV83_04335 [Candidatus Anstonellaceae archaeon]